MERVVAILWFGTDALSDSINVFVQAVSNLGPHWIQNEVNSGATRMLGSRNKIAIAGNHDNLIDQSPFSK